MYVCMYIYIHISIDRGYTRIMDKKMETIITLVGIFWDDSRE